jgi:prepilin-type N-terminal cleavage/methylation domain-containing protein
MRTQRRTRRGFTLVELLVVIGIMLVISALGYWLLPGMIGNQNRARAVDQLTEWILTVKVRARRDGLATGVRILVDPTTNLASQVAYVQQPDPLTGGTCQGTCDGSSNLTTGTAQQYVLFSGVDFVGPAALTASTTNPSESSPTDYSQALVQPGDYLEVNYSGNVHLITGFAFNSGTGLTRVSLNSNIPAFGSTTAAGTSYPTVYRILRQPRLLVGEELKSLGAELAIDFNALASPALSSKSLNVPSRTVGTATYYEIVFSPSGSVVGQGTMAGKVILWISDNAVTNTPAPPALIAINNRTGFIGAYEVAPGSDPYLFTEDGRSGGF